jgi:hypothetical protein
VLKVSSTTSVPAAPTGLSATAGSATQVQLAWTDGDNTDTGIKVERSTDGTNFTQITVTAAHAAAYTDTGLAAGTRYYYRVRATNAAGDSAYSNVANATTQAATTTYLSDLAWASASIGWGTIGQDQSVEGNPLTLDGTAYPKGIGTHAVSRIVYDLGGRYARFLGTVGVDDEVATAGGPGSGSVVFQVFADGVMVYDSGVMHQGQPALTFDVGVAGVRQLTLAVDAGGDGIDDDHADWAGARVIT